ncbi:MAG: ComEC/Rec2 family competence protein [Ruminococcaceae bacterium]|nr:ComEC/Rec2 family competence protein [Oscillospiraceae bacterium]
MHLFYRRPLAFAATLFTLSAVFAFRMDGRLKLALIALFAVSFFIAFLLYFLKHRTARRFCVLLCLGAVLLSLLASHLFFQCRYQSLRAKTGDECRAEGYVLERISGEPFYSALRVHVTSLDGEPASFDAILEMEFPSSLQLGDGFTVTAIPREYTAEETFEEETFRLSDGCFLILTVKDRENCVRTEKQHPNIGLFSAALNQRLSFLLRETVGGEAGGLCAAPLFGNRTWLSDTTALAFRRAGISHLLALSGLHVSILIAFLEFLLRRLHTPRKLRAVLIPLFAIGYLLLTGCAVSTCRAVLMVCVLYLALLGGSRYDAFTALSVLLALILLFQPWSVCDLSLWMSFLSAASIIIFTPALSAALEEKAFLQRLPRLLSKMLIAILTAIFVGVVANFALFLLSAAVFGEISLASIPATLLLSIPITCLLVCAVFCLLFPFLPFLPLVCETLADLHLAVASFFSSIEAVMLPVNDLPTQLVLLLLTLVLIAIATLPLRRPLKWMVCLLPTLFAIAVITSVYVTQFSPQYHAKTQILTNYFGEIELRTEHGEAVLINRVRNNASEAYEIKHAALEARCTDIDHLIFTRYYNQSTYFLSRLCTTMRVEVLHLPIPTNAREEAIAARVEQEASLYGVRVVYDAHGWK